VITASATHRHIVDFEQLFHDATGFPTANYRRQFGAVNYNLRQEELLRSTLQTHDNGSVIVCNGSSLTQSSYLLLQEFSKDHAMIHITRNIQSIQKHLEVLDIERLERLVALSGPILRRCCNYEFYNISEVEAICSKTPAKQPSVRDFLTLKQTEQNFLKLLSRIEMQRDVCSVIYSPSLTLESGFPLSEVPVELRQYTYAVQIPLPVLLSEDVDIEELEFSSDAFEIVVEPAELDSQLQGLNSDRAEQLSKSISRVRSSTVIPIIYHVIPASSTNSGQDSYIEHVRHGLRMAPEFLTVDLTLAEDTILEVVRTRGLAKIIGHLHAAIDWYKPFWLEKYEMAIRLGCNLVRFTRPTNFMDDNAAIQSFRNKITERTRAIPLICFNTGRAGRHSACFNDILTSVIPESLRCRADFAKFVNRNPETSWLTAREATQSLYTSFVYDPMQFYTIGTGAEYSLSPAMHNVAYQACGMPHRYQALRNSNLNSLQELVQNLDFGGTATSGSFKTEEVVALTHSLSRHARVIGTVNTITPVRHLNDDASLPEDLKLFQERNRAGPIKALYGDNTNWIGIRSCILRGLSPANGIRASTCGLVTGSGSMARVAVYAMQQLGVKNIVVFSRTVAKAEKLVAHFTQLNSKASSNYVEQETPATFRILKTLKDPWPYDLRQPTIIVSCKAYPFEDSSKQNFTLPGQWMEGTTGGVIVEMAHRAFNTPLMQQVRAEAYRGWIHMDVLDMLIEQEFAQFELFTGKRAPRKIMREEALRIG
jgi:shikimate 5-dehydrogenase